jgi:hypothetical protein
MRITTRKLSKLIEEDDSNRFLHGYENGDPFDDESEMVSSQLHRLKEMSENLLEMLSDGDQLPSWVQSHIAVAHENISQVYSYLEPQDDTSEAGEQDEGDQNYWHSAASWGDEGDDD